MDRRWHMKGKAVLLVLMAVIAVLAPAGARAATQVVQGHPAMFHAAEARVESDVAIIGPGESDSEAGYDMHAYAKDNMPSRRGAFSSPVESYPVESTGTWHSEAVGSVPDSILRFLSSWLA